MGILLNMHSPQSVNIPLGLSSKGAQIQAIRSEGTSDNVAAAAWVTNAVTGMMRLFTHLNSKVEVCLRIPKLK